jgi:hypothetical protein
MKLSRLWELLIVAIIVASGPTAAAVAWLSSQYDRKLDAALAPAMASIKELQNQISSLKGDINGEFAKFSKLKTTSTFQNAATLTGSGYDSTAPPGRCLENEVVVGMQPMQGNATVFRMTCAEMPKLQLR